MDRLRSRQAMVPVVEAALRQAMMDGMIAGDDTWVSRWAESYGAVLAAAREEAPEACGYIALHQKLDPVILDGDVAQPRVLRIAGINPQCRQFSPIQRFAGDSGRFE